MILLLPGASVPQADNLNLLLKMLEALHSGGRVAPDAMGVHGRQVAYYTAALRVLGLVVDGAVTARGARLAIGDLDRRVALRQGFQESQVGRAWSEWSRARDLVRIDGTTAVQFLAERSELTGTTLNRRARTLRCWLDEIGLDLDVESGDVGSMAQERASDWEEFVVAAPTWWPRAEPPSAIETAWLSAWLERARRALTGFLAWDHPEAFVRVVRARVQGGAANPDVDPSEQAFRRAAKKRQRTCALVELEITLERRARCTSDVDLRRLRRRVIEHAFECALSAEDLRGMIDAIQAEGTVSEGVRHHAVTVSVISAALVRGHVGLIDREVRKARYANRGLDVDDLYQEGALGLMRGVDTFNFRLGTTLATYVTWWIFARIQRALANNERTIRIPSGTLEIILQVRRFTARWQREHGCQPNLEEMAAGLGKPREAVARAVQIDSDFERGASSLTEPAGTVDDEHGTLADWIPARDPDPEDIVGMVEAATRLRAAIAQMNARDQEVLRLRLGLEDGEGWTLRQIGVHLGLSRERVRQLERVALEPLASMLTEVRAVEGFPSGDSAFVTGRGAPAPGSTPPLTPSPTGPSSTTDATQPAPAPKPSLGSTLVFSNETLVDLCEQALQDFRRWLMAKTHRQESAASQMFATIRGASRLYGNTATLAELNRWAREKAYRASVARHYLRFARDHGHVVSVSRPVGGDPTFAPAHDIHVDSLLNMDPVPSTPAAELPPPYTLPVLAATRSSHRTDDRSTSVETPDDTSDPPRLSESHPETDPRPRVSPEIELVAPGSLLRAVPPVPRLLDWPAIQDVPATRNVDVDVGPVNHVPGTWDGSHPVVHRVCALLPAVPSSTLVTRDPGDAREGPGASGEAIPGLSRELATPWMVRWLVSNLGNRS